MVRLRGPALSGLIRPARRRLLVAALGFGRRRRLDLGLGPAWALLGYAALALPEARQVALDRPRTGHGLGVVDAVDGSLAVLTVGPAGARIDAWGGPGAEGAVRSVVERWERAGQPGVAAGRVTVRYGPVRPAGWWCSRRGDQWLALDWAPAVSGR